ncbi:MAG: hypothetical protein AAF245_03175 [Pseudomonadota bacterium]
MTDNEITYTALSLAAVLLTALYLVLRDRHRRLALSYLIGLLQLAVAAGSTALSAANRISAESCFTGLIGFYATPLIAVIDTISLALLLRQGTLGHRLGLLVFIVTRLGIHSLVMFAHYIAVMLCTV